MALSQQEFEKLKTQLQSKKTGGVTTPTVETPDYISRVGAELKGAYQGLQKTTERGAELMGEGKGIEGAVMAGLGAPATAVRVAFSPITAALSPVIEGGLKASGITEWESVQNTLAGLDTWAKAHPDAAENLKNIFEIGSTVGAGKLATAVKPALEQGIKTGAEATVGAIKTGAKAVTPLAKGGIAKITDVITPIEKGVETVLNPTTIIPKESLKKIPIEKIIAQQEPKLAKLDRYTKIGEKAVSDFSQKTPMSVAGDKGTEALTVLNNKLSKQGLLKQEALGKVGDKIVANIGEVKLSLLNKIKEKVGLNIVLKEGEINLVPATGRASKIAFDPADNKLITDSYKMLEGLGKKPTVRQLDDTVDALQDLLYKRKSAVAIPVNGQVEGVLKGITGQLNRSVKKVAGEQYTKANAKFAHFIDVRDKLNKALGDEGVRGASLMKQLFSPSGEAPRRLFRQIKELTGIDLVEEATLAKFVMENVGDARQASLLEEVIKGQVGSPTSFIEKAAKITIGKLQKPIEKARRVIQK